MDGVYFNEIDRFAARWLRNLYPDALVDQRSISDVAPDDLLGYRRVHFFAGIGGWEYALQRAGWPDDWSVWTGSCPCQPFSCAGKRQGERDERHLWPEFHRLIRECRPVAILGEQVASRDGLEWLDGISLDLEEIGYAVGSVDLAAASVGAPHTRQRVFWCALGQLGHTNGPRWDAWSQERKECVEAWCEMPATRVKPLRLGKPSRTGPPGRSGEPGDDGAERSPAERTGDDAGGLAEPECGGNADDGPGTAPGPSGGMPGADRERERLRPDPWKRSHPLLCLDGKARRISLESGDEPLAHGIHTRRRDPRLGYLLSRLEGMGYSPKDARRILRKARANRAGRLKGYGNAIVSQAAAMFVRAVMDQLHQGQGSPIT